MTLEEYLSSIEWNILNYLTPIKPYVIYLHLHPVERYSLVMLLLLCIIVLVLWPSWKKVTKDPVNINALAGEDVATTQLDLAKAYLEMDQKKQAKKILKQVARRGKGEQKQLAKRLLASL